MCVCVLSACPASPPLLTGCHVLALRAHVFIFHPPGRCFSAEKGFSMYLCHNLTQARGEKKVWLVRVILAEIASRKMRACIWIIFVLFKNVLVYCDLGACSYYESRKLISLQVYRSRGNWCLFGLSLAAEVGVVFPLFLHTLFFRPGRKTLLRNQFLTVKYGHIISDLDRQCISPK